MTAPCPSEAPEYYTTILHCIAAVSAPVNVFALYLVFWRSPGISKYKYGIIYMQLATFLTELQQSLVCPGYYFFPLLGGFNTSQLFGAVLRGHLLMTMWVFFLASELPAITWCFIYRHNSAVDMTTNQKKSRLIKKTVFASTQIFPFATSFGFYMSEISENDAQVFLSHKYPQCLPWLKSKAFSIYDWNTNAWIAFVGLGAMVFVCLFIVLVTILGGHTMLLLHKLRAHMSAQTYKMHRTALIGLSLQVIIPSVLLMLPLYICLYVVARDLVEYQGMATNSTILIACHSLGSSIVMIAANPRYRKILQGCCGKPFRSHPPSTVSHSIVRRLSVPQQRNSSLF